MKGTLVGGFLDKVKEFEGALTPQSKSDQARPNSISLPPLYNNLVENLGSKEGYTYGDISRQVRLYVPARQERSEKRRDKRRASSAKADSKKKVDTSKTCKYCIDVKGWKGIGHTESEYFTKKREAKKVEAESEDEGGASVLCTSIGKIETKGFPV